MKIGLVIGTFAAVPYVHLQLESARRFSPNSPILIHDDSSHREADLRDLAARYGADFTRTPKRMPHHLGDLSVYPTALRWAQDQGIDYLMKVSRRWIWKTDWESDLRSLIEVSDGHTYSNATISYQFGFRTECVVFKVGDWVNSGFIQNSEKSIADGKHVFVEAYIHAAAGAIPMSDKFRRWSESYPFQSQKEGYVAWPLMGICRERKSPERLWHDCDHAREYAELARQWGLPYSEADFVDANDGRGTGGDPLPLKPVKAREDIQWVVFTPEFQWHSGGLLVLYRLAHELELLGLNVLITHSTRNERYKTPFASIEQIAAMPKENMVAIYPEIIGGNPLGAKHVIRWMLNQPGYIRPVAKFAETDILYRYAPRFAESAVDLCVLDFETSEYFDKGLERSGDCHFVHKGQGLPNSYSDPDSERIDHFRDIGGFDYIKDVFNRRKRFISYDDCTFMSVMAALCGCESIVVPREGVSSEMWRAGHPLLRRGVSYGFDDPHGRETVDGLRDYIEAMKAIGVSQVEKMVQDITAVVSGAAQPVKVQPAPKKPRNRYVFKRGESYRIIDGVRSPIPKHDGKIVPCGTCKDSAPDPSIWGPPKWVELHAASKILLTPRSRATFLQNWSKTIPCPECAEHWQNVLAGLPARMEGIPEFSQWCIDAHNAVNTLLSKPQWIDSQF